MSENTGACDDAMKQCLKVMPKVNAGLEDIMFGFGSTEGPMVLEDKGILFDILCRAVAKSEDVLLLTCQVFKEAFRFPRVVKKA